jgi:hypothetical protein
MAWPVKTPLSPVLCVVISAVAETRFAERGFDGTYLREIARRAGSTAPHSRNQRRRKDILCMMLL